MRNSKFTKKHSVPKKLTKVTHFQVIRSLLIIPTFDKLRYQGIATRVQVEQSQPLAFNSATAVSCYLVLYEIKAVPLGQIHLQTKT